MDLSTDDGRAAYRRYLDGDKNAFDELLALYFNNLTFFINRLVFNVHDAEDLAIDTLLVLMTDPKRYRFDSSLKTYLYTVARNKALNFLRHKRALDLTDPNDLEEEEDRQSLEDDVLDSERKRALHVALKTLPEEMQTVVYLVYFESLSYEETAHIMKKNVKQVDNLLSRAKRELRGLLERG